jgi:hypothetical protein
MRMVRPSTTRCDGCRFSAGRRGCRLCGMRVLFPPSKPCVRAWRLDQDRSTRRISRSNLSQATTKLNPKSTTTMSRRNKLVKGFHFCRLHGSTSSVIGSRVRAFLPSHRNKQTKNRLSAWSLSSLIAFIHLYSGRRRRTNLSNDSFCAAAEPTGQDPVE